MGAPHRRKQRWLDIRCDHASLIVVDREQNVLALANLGQRLGERRGSGAEGH
jgi:hypothetical protein